MFRHRFETSTVEKEKVKNAESSVLLSRNNQGKNSVMDHFLYPSISFRSIFSLTKAKLSSLGVSSLTIPAMYRSMFSHQQSKNASIIDYPPYPPSSFHRSPHQSYIFSSIKKTKIPYRQKNAILDDSLDVSPIKYRSIFFFIIIIINESIGDT